MKRKLRISNHQDYLAVDFVDTEGNIKSTPLYWTPKESPHLLAFDDDDKKWHECWITDVYFPTQIIYFKDYDGFEWDSNVNELLDENLYKFIQKKEAV